MAGHRGIVIGALTWNLFHGRDYPPERSLLTWRSRLLRVTERGATHAQVNAPLLEAFALWLARRPWDVALLQEAPPRWLGALGRRCQASGALALTSRNWLSPVRARLADWNPDLLASAEGGSNQLLVREPARILAVRRLSLTHIPERRRMLWSLVEVRGGARLAVANVHLSAHYPAAAGRELERAATQAVEWAGEHPLLLGGDLNLRPVREPARFESLRDRLRFSEPSEPEAIDHLLARGLEPVGRPASLAPEERDVAGPDGLRVRLSDHAPVRGEFRLR
jgi:endonuclease/exonuclease/phosphatase family metal-dependent hydrolase